MPPLLQGKARSGTYSVCVFVALGIQHAMRMRRVTLSSVACRALLYFSTVSQKRHDFRRKLLSINCVFSFSLQISFETFLILRRIERDMIKMFLGLRVDYPLFSSDFNKI